MAGSDIFISYKSEQRSWAERLAKDLRRYGFAVFLDHDTAKGLQSGEAWKKQLAEEIRGAQHFLLLWSDQIVTQSYVLKEVKVRQDVGGTVTVVMLDDSKPAAVLDEEIQGFREFIELAQANPEADNVPFFEWHRAVRHLANSTPLGDGRSSVVEIPTVVVAMTATQANELALGNKVAATIEGSAYEQMMSLLDETTPFDPGRYGETPEDWKPFAPVLDPADPTVEDVIGGYDDALRRWRRDHPDEADVARYAFVPYGAALRDAVSGGRVRERLKSRPSLVVFDPVSLMHQEVNSFVLANGLHTLTRAFVIGLGPQLSTSSQPVRNYFGGIEQALFEGLMMTDPRERARALFYPTLSTCVLNVTHQFELSKWLQIASQGIIDWVDRSRSQMNPAYRDLVREGPELLRLVPGGRGT